MRLLRHLAVVSVAPLSAVLLLPFTVQAQSAARPSNQPAVRATPAPFVVQISPSQLALPTPTPQTKSSPAYSLPQFSPDKIHTFSSLKAQKLPLLAGNEGNCYAMRTYAFTTPQDSAMAPRLSGYTTCTPAAKAHLKELVKVPPSQ